MTCTTATVTVPATAYAPTVLTTGTTSSTNPKVGDSVTMTGTLQNTGGTAGSSTVYVVFYGAYIASKVISVAANSTSPISITFTIPTSTSAGTVTAGTAYNTCLALS